MRSPIAETRQCEQRLLLGEKTMASKMSTVEKGSRERQYTGQKRRHLIHYINNLLFAVGILVSSAFYLPLHSRSLQVHNEQDIFQFSLQSLNSNATNLSGPLKIAWLMSYPNSGTSYTLELIRILSRTYIASNYARETKKIYRVPVFNNTPSPFWVHHNISNATYPKHYVLTKTHCGVESMKRWPLSYLESTYSFRNKCLTAKHRQGKWIYNHRFVSKAIHLIRNPFDNIVARFHLDRESEVNHDDVYPKTKEGFRSYCAMLDAQHALEENSIPFLKDALALLQNVPCRSDFVRYIEWHNMAFITTQDLELDTYILYYDWYEMRFNETVSELLQFLHLERRGKIRQFIPGKVYQDYFYTKEERKAVRVAFRRLATKTTWKHIERYFVDS